MPHALPRVLALALVIAFSAAAPTRADSLLRMTQPESLGSIDVATYDEHGAELVGPGFVAYEPAEDGLVRFVGLSGIEGAEQTKVTALFEPAPDGEMLRPVLQESRSLDAQGVPLGVMTIDHRLGTGTCHPNGEEARSVALPEDDRVANVILGQVLVPLAVAGRGESSFQILICRPTVRVVRVRARVRENAIWDKRDLVEIETGPDLGPMLNRLLGPWLPKVSLWFDGSEPGWLGHRVPLFAKGPTVTVLRADIAEKLAPKVRLPY